jgi:hypothetical protein
MPKKTTTIGIVLSKNKTIERPYLFVILLTSSLHDIKKRIRVGGTDMNDDVLTRKAIEFPSEMVFGKPNRPSTPIHDILNHHFLYDWIDNMQNEEAARVASKKENEVNTIKALKKIT